MNPSGFYVDPLYPKIVAKLSDAKSYRSLKTSTVKMQLWLIRENVCIDALRSFHKS